ncbi:MAG: alpha/beta fold hydrolase [Thermomicrobiales bacterium]
MPWLPQGRMLRGIDVGITQGGASMDTGAPIVLIHGAWHGGWCWQRLVPLLRANGHEVYTPTLTGLGERAHLLAPTIDLTTHIEDVLAVLVYEGLSGVILVGHSYGGMVVSGVIERAPERIAQAIYLDAFLPEHGESIRDLGLPGLDEMAATHGDGWRLPPPSRAAEFGVADPRDADWIDTRLGDQPYATFTQPITLTAGDRGIPGAFILTSPVLFPAHADRARARGFAIRELPEAGHDSMVTMPGSLAAVILDLVHTASPVAVS